MFRFTDSPLVQELFAELDQRHIMVVLKARFPSVPADIVEALRAFREEEQTEKLIGTAVTCPDLEAFRAALVDATKSS
jgi:hypothetical protein